MLKVIINFFKLSRIDTCLLLFITIFVPSYYHERVLINSLAYSLPFITMCICTFIINDINDHEKDIVNHPNRPLPTKQISQNVAISMYFFFLFLSLVLLKIFIPVEFVFLYITFFILVINYDYFVSAFPYLKNLYVSISSIIPIIILSYVSPGDYGYFYTTISLFFFILGREMLMDIEDVKGDGKTLIKIIGIENSSYIAIFIQGIGILILWFAVNSAFDITAIIFLVVIFLHTSYNWFAHKNRYKLFFIMKIQMLISILILLE